MFYFSTHLTKKKIAAAFCCLLIPIGVAALSAGINSGVGQSPDTSQGERQFSYVGATRDDRIKFLEQFGWEADANTEQQCATTIPSADDTVYATYLSIQNSQGFSLEQYAGQTVTQYTYKITNHPQSEDYIYANILVLDGTVIGGDIHNSQVGGFVKGFRR